MFNHIFSLFFKKDKHATFSVPGSVNTGTYKNIRVKTFYNKLGVEGLAILFVSLAVLAGMPGFANKPTGTYTASLKSTDGNTWSYDIELADSNESANGISHLDVQFDCFLDNLDDVYVTSSSVEGEGNVQDGDSGPEPDVSGYLVKWDKAFSDPTTVSVTLSGGPYATDPNGATVIVKYGNNTVLIPVPGPDCSPAPEPAALTLVKQVINDDGGTASATDWTLTATGPDTISGTTGSSAVTSSSVDAGTYTLSETGGPSGYTAGDWSCVINGESPVMGNSVTLSEGDDATCTIVNDDDSPERAVLTVIKNVINDDGTLSNTASDFTMEVSGTNVSSSSFAGSSSGTIITLDAGSYSVDESDTLGYTKTLSADCSGTIGAGETKTCIITNDDPPEEPANLTLQKIVINNSGGLAVATDFQARIDGDPVDWNKEQTLLAGTYTLSETGGPSGYIAGAWDCNGGTLNNNNLTLSAGDDITCKITNTDSAPTLSLVKEVSGGTATANNWTLYATPSTHTALSGAGGFLPTPAYANTIYVLTESTGPANYNAGSWSCDGGTLNNGNELTLALAESVVCKIVNTYEPPEPATLIVIKNVINDDGTLSNTASDFTMEVSGTNVSSSSFAGSSSGTIITLDAGSYSVDESDTLGYTKTLSADCSGTIGAGETKTCIITNDDPEQKTGTITLIKKVINDNGGTAVVSSFKLFINGVTEMTSGVAKLFNIGNYAATENNISGYDASDWSGDCDENGNISLSSNQDAVCEITNDDIAPKLTLVKNVINNDGGTATANDWTLTATPESNQIGASAVNGDGNPNDGGGVNAEDVFANIVYTLSESGPGGYTAGSWTCEGGVLSGDELTLSLGDIAVCEITNNDNPTPPPPPPNPSSPNLTIDKTVSVDITDPDTVISYTIVVTNIGSASANNVLLEDVLPEGFTYVETGTDFRSWSLGNMFPGDSETRTYEVLVGSGVEPGIYTNTATVSATNHGPRSDTASVRVRGVLGEIFEPVLNIKKVGDKKFVNPGGQLTYTVDVTNVGEAAAVNLVVVDTLPNGFTLAKDGSTTITWNLPTLAVGETWTTSFLVNISSEAAIGQHVNIVRANADNYATELYASYTVEVRKGGVLGETGSSLWVLVSMIAGLLLFIAGISGVIREIRA